MIVLDASAGIALLTNQAGSGALVGRRVAHEQVHVPHVFDLEVVQALRGLLRAGKQTRARAEESLTSLERLPLERWPHDGMGQRIWQLCDNLTAYDAAYVALAETLDVPLVTLDAKLAAAARPSARVELVSA